MSTAYFIVLERPIAGLDTEMSGKSLAHHMQTLDQAARELGVKPLSEFFSADPEEMAEFIDSEDLAEIQLPPLEQFSAWDGLTAVRALEQHPLARDENLAYDLRDCERILSTAAHHHVGWHFELDI